jgi:acetolactate synthase-1/2/3 large subunit
VGHRIAGADALEPLLKKCHGDGGLHLIEVPIDYSDSDRILNHEIKSLSAKL